MNSHTPLLLSKIVTGPYPVWFDHGVTCNIVSDNLRQFFIMCFAFALFVAKRQHTGKQYNYLLSLYFPNIGLLVIW